MCCGHCLWTLDTLAGNQRSCCILQPSGDRNKPERNCLCVYVCMNICSPPVDTFLKNVVSHESAMFDSESFVLQGWAACREVLCVYLCKCVCLCARDDSRDGYTYPPSPSSQLSPGLTLLESNKPYLSQLM